MKVSFRHGLISYKKNGQNQGFLEVNGNRVNLVVSNGDRDPLIATIAHKNSNYLHTEEFDVNNAWGTFENSGDYYLYIDINQLSGVRTFGFSTTKPVVSSNAPSNPSVGDHWFDTVAKVMKTFNGTRWIEVVRLFVAHYDGVSAFKPLGQGTPNFSFGGSTVGSNTPILAGTIVLDNTTKPFKRSDGTFFTTVDQFITRGASTHANMLEASLQRVEYTQSIAAYQVVKYSDFGKVEVANYNDTGDNVLAITLEDGSVGDIKRVTVQGVVENPNWGWDTVGAKLWVLANGILTDQDPNSTDPITYPDKQVPVAKVLSQTEIIFEQGLGGVGPRGISGSAESVPATTSSIGGVAISVNPSSSSFPIAVEDNDPRLTNARTPTAHNHQANEVIYTATGNISSTNVQAALTELDSEKLAKAGGTMTGPLTLNSNPTVALHAATKSYVDGLVGGGITWLDPVDWLDIVADDLSSPPTNPQDSDIYIIAGTPAGAWSAFSTSEVVRWDSDDTPEVEGTVHTIMAVDATADSFSIQGNHTSDFTTSVTFTVSGSTSNDGSYTVTGSSTYDSNDDRTTITVAEDITSSIPDGQITVGYSPAIGAWQSLGLLSSFPTDTRFGIAVVSSKTPSGTFSGRKNQIATLADPSIPIWDFETPVDDNAFFVDNTDSFHAFNQFVYDAPNSKWIHFGGAAAVVPGENISVTENVWSVRQASDGGTVDAYTVGGVTLDGLVQKGPENLVRLTSDLTVNIPGDYPSVEHAMIDVGQRYNFNDWNLIIQLADATYSASTVPFGTTHPASIMTIDQSILFNCQSVTLRGNTTTPANVLIEMNDTQYVGVHAIGAGKLAIEGIQFAGELGATYTEAVLAENSSKVSLRTNEWGPRVDVFASAYNSASIRVSGTRLNGLLATTTPAAFVRSDAVSGGEVVLANVTADGGPALDFNNETVTFTTLFGGSNIVLDDTNGAVLANAGNATFTDVVAAGDFVEFETTGTVGTFTELVNKLGITVSRNDLNDFSVNGKYFGVQNNIKTITGTTHTLTSADYDHSLLFTNGSPITVTLPEQATENVGDGFKCRVFKSGGGDVTFVSQGTDVIDATNGVVEIVAQNNFADILLQINGAPSTWNVNVAGAGAGVLTTLTSDLTVTVPTQYTTVEDAVADLSQRYDFNSFNLTIDLADGTYTPANTRADSAFLIKLDPSPLRNLNALIFRGNPTTPGNCILEATDDSFICLGVTGGSVNEVQLDGIRFQGAAGSTYTEAIFSEQTKLTVRNCQWGPNSDVFIYTNDAIVSLVDGNSAAGINTTPWAFISHADGGTTIIQNPFDFNSETITFEDFFWDWRSDIIFAQGATLAANATNITVSGQVVRSDNSIVNVYELSGPNTVESIDALTGLNKSILVHGNDDSGGIHVGGRYYGNNGLGKEITDTAYTLTSSDFDQTLFVNNASTVTITLPEQATEALGQFFYTNFVKTGAGDITFVTQGTDTIESSTGIDTITAQHGTGLILLRTAGAPNTWVLTARTEIPEDWSFPTYTETTQSITSSGGVAAIDVATAVGNVFKIDMTENITSVTMTNIPAGPDTYSFTIDIDTNGFTVSDTAFDTIGKFEEPFTQLATGANIELTITGYTNTGGTRTKLWKAAEIDFT